MNWHAPEFHFYEKNAKWRLTTIVATVAGLLLAIWQRNIMFGIFLVLAEALLLSQGNKKPRDIEYELTDEGFKVGEREYYEYVDLLGFSLFNDPLAPHHHELVLRKNNNRTMQFLVPDELVEEMQDFLLDHLDELEYEESIMNHLSKRIGV